jgi:hypothetical protein
MMTVQQVAESYGVSTTFLVQALDQIGFANAKPDTALSTATITRFEAKFGAKIRAVKDKQARQEPDLRSQRLGRHSAPHVMRVAHAKVGAGRDSGRNRVKVLLDDPGIVHAIDAAGTWDGDPWSGKVLAGDSHFFGGKINSGPSAACGKAYMRAVLSEEFVPADNPESAGQCKRCADLVADGKGFRDGPGYMGSPYCDASIRVKIDGDVAIKTCFQRFRHGGPHRAPDKSEWDIGLDDYVPAPGEIGSRITKAS